MQQDGKAKARLEALWVRKIFKPWYGKSIDVLCGLGVDLACWTKFLAFPHPFGYFSPVSRFISRPEDIPTSST